MSQSLKRDRKKNFADGEVMLLLQSMVENRYILMSKSATSVMLKEKKAIWDGIASNICALGYDTRTADDVRKKWHDIKTHVLSILRQELGPGGGPPPKRPTWMDIVLDLIDERSDLFTGLEGPKIARPSTVDDDDVNVIQKVAAEKNRVNLKRKNMESLNEEKWGRYLESQIALNQDKQKWYTESTKLIEIQHKNMELLNDVAALKKQKLEIELAKMK